MTVVIVSLIGSVTVLAVARMYLSRPVPPIPQRVASLLDERLLASVVVTLKSGTAFAGVLYAEDKGAVVLCKAEHIAPDGSRTAVDGEVVMLRSDVDFVQRP